MIVRPMGGGALVALRDPNPRFCRGRTLFSLNPVAGHGAEGRENACFDIPCLIQRSESAAYDVLIAGREESVS